MWDFCIIPYWRQIWICWHFSNRHLFSYTCVFVDVLPAFSVAHSALFKWCTVCCLYWEGEVTLVAADLLCPWHGARTGLASSARHWTSQHQIPLHHVAKSLLWLRCNTAREGEKCYCFLYHTANLTDSRLEVILVVCTIHFIFVWLCILDINDINTN